MTAKVLITYKSKQVTSGRLYFILNIDSLNP